MKNLFIVDDDPDDRDILMAAFSENGFKNAYCVFDNGALLMEFLSRNNELVPDLILLDINMPVMDGFETLKQLNTTGVIRSVPVVMLTSSSRSEDRRTCAQLGCKDFQVKPMDLDGYISLGNIIESYL